MRFCANEKSFRLYRRQLRLDSNPFDLSNERFIELFRLNKQLVRNLIQDLNPHLRERVYNTAVSNTIKVCCALRFYATGSYQRCVGQEFNIALSQTMVSRVVHEVTIAIDAHLSAVWIRFPVTVQGRLSIKETIMNRWHIGGCVGFIDGT